MLYAPGLSSADDIATVVRSVDRPVNVLMGRPGQGIDMAALAAMGVKRVSVGSALSRVALGAFLSAARELRELGTFEGMATAVGYADLNAMFDP